MAKYNLVAFYYDMFERNPNLKYKNEVVIEEQELKIDLSTLQAIDRFTAQHSRSEIFQILEQKLEIKGKNHLAIKYQKNKNSNPVYYRIIENQPNFIPLTEKNEKIMYWAFGQKISSLAVDKTSELFRKERETLRSLLEESNYEELNQKFPFQDSMLSRLIHQYFFGSHDNVERDKENWKKLIELEFSRYKTFRGWYITKLKGISYHHERQPITPTTSKKTIIPKTQKEYEEEFLKNFQEKNSISWEQSKTSEYNDRYEESLTSEEYEKMFGFDEEDFYDDFKNQSNTTRIRRR